MNLTPRKILWLVIALSILLVVIYLGISVYIAHSLTQISPKTITVSRDSISPNSRDITFKAPDGINLSGWLFESESKNAVILVHGIGEVRTNEYSNGVELIKNLLSKNYNVLVYDTRGNGQSEKARLTFGQNEGKDIEGAISFLKSEGFKNENIGIIANSLGAISLLQNIENIKAGALIADSPAAEIEPIIRRELIETENIPEFMIPGIYFTANILFGLDINSIRPIDKVDSNDKILFFHGSADTFINPSNSQALINKTHRESKLVIFENSKHVEEFKDHPEQYLNEVFGYLEQRLSGN